MQVHKVLKVPLVLKVQWVHKAQDQLVLRELQEHKVVKVLLVLKVLLELRVLKVIKVI